MKRAVILPAIMLIYLIVMVVKGWPLYCAGETSPLLYFGGTALCVVCIIFLHFNLKRAARRHKEKDKE